MIAKLFAETIGETSRWGGRWSNFGAGSGFGGETVVVAFALLNYQF